MHFSSINQIDRISNLNFYKYLEWVNKQAKLFAVVLALTVSFLTASAQNKVIASRVDSLLIDLQNANQFSGAVILSHNGEKTVLKNAYGFSNFSDSSLNLTNTQFSLASLGKIFTIVATLKLIENKRLELEDSLGKFNLDFKDKRAESITVKQLLSHTSGFGHYWENENYIANKTQLDNLNEYIKFIRLIPLDFEPGTNYQYSNVGYIILGKIIESVTENDYYDYIKRTIFKPLKMNNTNFNYKSEIGSNYAKKYSKTESGKLKEVKNDLSLRSASDGGGYSTIDDLSKLSDAIFYDGFLSDQSVSLMTSNFESHTLKRNEWTFDLVGGAPGVSTVMGFHGPSRYSIVVLSNMDSPASETVLIGALGIITEELSKPIKKDNKADLDVYSIKGRVVDISTKEPIPYVNIGIKNEGIGTASGEGGYFELKVPNTHKKEDIIFSALGYSEEKHSALKLFEQGGQTIELNEKKEQLDEVILTAKKPKTERVGNSHLGLFSSGAYIGGGSPGATLITKIQTPSERSKLQKVFVHIRNNDLKKNFKLRVRILESGTNNNPDKELLNKSVIVSSNIEKGWLLFDLRDMNLVFDDEIYIGVEWIEELDERLSMKDAFPRISYSSSNKAESFARTTSFNSWNSIPIKPNIYAEFLTK